MTIFVRHARLEDVDDLVRLAAALNAGEGNPTDLFTHAFVETAIFAPAPELKALVAEIAGKVVAMALYHDCVNSGFGQFGVYLNDLFVDAAHRRQGVALRLMAALADETRARGRTFLWWTVKPSNAEGLAFYRMLGAGAEGVAAHAISFARFDALADLHRGLGEPGPHKD